jgi:hypothetical protein
LALLSFEQLLLNPHAVPLKKRKPLFIAFLVRIKTLPIGAVVELHVAPFWASDDQTLSQPAAVVTDRDCASHVPRTPVFILLPVLLLDGSGPVDWSFIPGVRVWERHGQITYDAGDLTPWSPACMPKLLHAVRRAGSTIAKLGQEGAVLRRQDDPVFGLEAPDLILGQWRVQPVLVRLGSEVPRLIRDGLEPLETSPDCSKFLVHRLHALAELVNFANRSVSLSRLAGQHNMGHGQHITTPVNRLRVAGP